MEDFRILDPDPYNNSTGSASLTKIAAGYESALRKPVGSGSGSAKNEGGSAKNEGHLPLDVGMDILALSERASDRRLLLPPGHLARVADGEVASLVLRPPLLYTLSPRSPARTNSNLLS